MSDEFVSWLWSSSDELDVDFQYLLERNGLSLSWFREVYHDLGPITPFRLRMLVEDAREKSSRAALEVMKREVEFFRKGVYYASIREGLSVMTEGRRGFFLRNRELYSLTTEDAILEIGEIVQDEIIQRDREVWPLCELHGTGLHLRTVAGHVVWWCQPGEHSVRVIYPK